MDILKLIVKHWDEILVGLIIAITIFSAGSKFVKSFQKMTDEEKIAYIKRLLTNLVPIALALVTDAEIKFGGGTGKIKRATVIDGLYSRIPDEYKPYITVENLDSIINNVLVEAEKMWGNNPSIKTLLDGSN